MLILISFARVFWVLFLLVRAVLVAECWLTCCEHIVRVLPDALMKKKPLLRHVSKLNAEGSSPLLHAAQELPPPGQRVQKFLKRSCRGGF